MSTEILLRLEGVSKRFASAHGGVLAVQNASGTLQAGEIVALFGRSGSGKSTLLTVAAALEPQTGGQVFVRGVDISTLKRSALETLRRETFGFIFQNFNLLPTLTALENVALALVGIETSARRRGALARAALARVDLVDRCGFLPRHLSGGQQQRVAIARAMVRKPVLIFADEPTANLDAASTETILTHMRNLAHEDGAAFLIATHDDRVRAYADREWRIDDGRLAAAAA